MFNFNFKPSPLIAKNVVVDFLLKRYFTSYAVAQNFGLVYLARAKKAWNDFDRLSLELMSLTRKALLTSLMSRVSSFKFLETETVSE